ncbi:hypothetical protein HDU92_000469 [Lobulomyces angularis]|nr:hypothetical protein HDU92_000469 [Lobulomyces angularis]
MLQQKWLVVAPWVRMFGRWSNPEKLKNVVPNLAFWGASAGMIALLIIEPTPLVRNDILIKLPGAGNYWKNKLEQDAQVD